MSLVLRHFTNLVIECCAAGIAPLLMHRRNKTPLVGFRPVALCRAESSVSVVASHGIDAPIQHGHAHIAAAIVHRCHLMPGVCTEVKPAHAVEMLHPVKATNTVDIAIEEGSAVIGARTLQIVGHIDPVVCSDIIHLNAISWIAAAPASDGKQDDIRQARTGKVVAHTKHRGAVCDEVTYGLDGIAGYLQTLIILLHQCIRHHVAPNVVHTC